MTEFSAPSGENSVGYALAWGLLAPLGLFGLGVLLILPLPWEEQGVLGVTLIAAALLLNWVSRAATVTMALMAISVFSTLRYGYWRVMQTWEGITSIRSEEHTSELQSQSNLVCRLLLEKKKKKTRTRPH